MNAALITGLSGLHRAQDAFTRAAGGIVRAGTVSRPEAVSSAPPARGPAGIAAPRGGFSGPAPDLPGAMVSMVEARHAYASAAKVVATSNDMTRTLLDALA